MATTPHPDLPLAAQAAKREFLAVRDLQAATRKRRWWHRYAGMPWYLRSLVLLAVLYAMWWVGRLGFAIYLVVFR